LSNVKLVPLSANISPPLYSILQNPEVTKYLNLTLPTFQDAQRYVHAQMEAEKRGLGVSRAILNEKNQVIGMVSIFNIHPQKKIGELGLFLGQGSWGKGHCMSAHSQMLDYAFRVKGLEVIVYFTDKRHRKVQQILNHLDMIEMNQGQRYPLVIFEKWLATGVWFDLHILTKARYFEKIAAKVKQTG
jgi:ribosomal-protein-alanine N-acetyltransferase